MRKTVSLIEKLNIYFGLSLPFHVEKNCSFKVSTEKTVLLFNSIMKFFLYLYNRVAFSFCKQNILILFFFFLIVIEPTSFVFAAYSCGDTGSCIIITDNYVVCAKGANKVTLNGLEGIDQTCSKLTPYLTGVILPAFSAWYKHLIQKYYWDGTYWNLIDENVIYSDSVTVPGVTVYNDATNPQNFKGPLYFFPNGCSNKIVPKNNFGHSGHSCPN